MKKIINLIIMISFLTLSFSSLSALPPCNSSWPCPPPVPLNNGWNYITITTIINGCNGCSMTVTFCERELTCFNPTVKQLQMVSFTVSNQCKLCFSDGVLFQKAIGIMLKYNTIAVPANNGDCIDGIEVVNVSCWKWTAGISAPWVMSWCNTDNCCTINYKICNQNGEFVIVYASNSSNYVDCVPEGGNACLYVCDWLPQVGVLAKSANLEEEQSLINTQFQNNSFTSPNPANSTIDIGLVNKINGNLNLKIFDSKGIEINSQTMSIENLESKFSVNTNVFPNGIYFYSIFLGLEKVADGKFIIIH